MNCFDCKNFYQKFEGEYISCTIYNYVELRDKDVCEGFELREGIDSKYYDDLVKK